MIHAVKQAVKYLFEIEDKSDYSIEKESTVTAVFIGNYSKCLP